MWDVQGLVVWLVTCLLSVISVANVLILKLEVEAEYYQGEMG